MKPDWKDAPDWANYIAQDQDGDWYWYSLCPTTSTCGEWVRPSGGRAAFAAGVIHPEWQETLQERPQ